VVLASSYDQARFLKAADLDGGEKKVRIKSVTEEKVGPDKDQKLVVWFTNDKRGFVLNQTNNRILREAFGDETDGWAGKIIVLFSSMTDFRGRVTPGLRVRIPPPKGDGRAAAQPVKPAAKPVVVDEDLDAEPPAKPDAKPSLADELDDEIPV